MSVYSGQGIDLRLEVLFTPKKSLSLISSSNICSFYHSSRHLFIPLGISLLSFKLLSITSLFFFIFRPSSSLLTCPVLSGMLLKAGPEKWIIQETKDIAEMNFRFLDKTNAATYATRLANNMQIVSPEHTVRRLTLQS